MERIDAIFTKTSENEWKVMQFQIRPDLPSVKTSSGEKVAKSSVKGGAWRER